MTAGDQARAFARLHQGTAPLVLPNAWDAMSARVFEAAGFAAVGTTSAGMAFQLGHADGEHMPVDELLASLSRIVRTVRVPVSADLEAGYGSSAARVAELVRRVVDVGVAGINLEDSRSGGLLTLGDQVERLAACRTAAERAGVPLYLNARTDVYWHRVGSPDTRLAEALRRGAAYLGAGADGVFVPGVTDEATMRALAAGFSGPLNVLATPRTPDVAQLAVLGVARVSTGSGPVRSVMGLLRRLAGEWQAAGTFSGLGGDALPYDDANDLFLRPD